MKNALINYSRNGAFDEVYTPDYAITPILKYIQKDKVIWCPFDNENSNYVKVFKENGYNVIYSHINDEKDFFTYIPEKFDIIVSNPPFSIKTKILKRCYEIGKPFALLLPITALEGIERGKLFREYGIQLLVFNKRIEFINRKGSGVWFNSSYFCYKLLPRDVIFEELLKKR